MQISVPIGTDTSNKYKVFVISEEKMLFLWKSYIIEN